MKFNSYLVELKHREINLTGNITVAGKSFSVNLKKIAKDIFTAQFKTQVELAHLDKIELRNRDKEFVVLLPLLSKYNKRKLTKLSKIFSNGEGREVHDILFNLLIVDKFVRVGDLLIFFSLNKNEVLDFIIQSEINKKIKLLELNDLIVTSFENYEGYLAHLNDIFTEYYSSRHKVLKFSEIESKLKLPQSSYLFRFLIEKLTPSFSVKIRKDRIVFQKVALSENEIQTIDKLSSILQKNKLSVFSFEDILNCSELDYKEINDSIWYLIERGEVVQLNEKYFIIKDELDKIINRLKKFKRNQGEMIDIKDLRELTLYSRKYLIALFEYFDSQRITLRDENQRKILLGV